MQCPEQRTVNLISYEADNVGKVRIFLGSSPLSLVGAFFTTLFCDQPPPTHTYFHGVRGF